MRVVSVATRSQLPRVQVLARSLRRFSPGWSFDVLLLGGMQPGDTTTGINVINVGDILDVEPELLFANHSVARLAKLLLPSLLEGCIDSIPVPTLHLPPGAWVLGDLGPIQEEVEARNIMLAARRSTDLPPDDCQQPSRDQLLDAGTLATELTAVDASDRARGFLSWWAARLRDVFGPLEVSTRNVADWRLRWLSTVLELAPTRFRTGIFDPGSSASGWNLDVEPLLETADGLTVGGRFPLRLIDLTDFDPAHPYRLGPQFSRVRFSREPALQALVHRYSDELCLAGWGDVTRRREIGRTLPNGIEFDEPMWTLFEMAYQLGADFGDLFSVDGTESFTQWLEQPVNGDTALGIPRYVFHRVTRERPDVVAAVGRIDATNRDFIRWCDQFGRYELGISDRFQPRPCAPTQAVSPTVTQSSGDAADSLVATGAEGPGVRVTGYLGQMLGLGAAARGYVQGLQAAGVPVSTVQVPINHPELLSSDEYGQLPFTDATHHHGHQFELVCINPDELPQFVDRVGLSYFKGPRIGVWGWETDSIPTRWRGAFELVDEIWVYSEFVAESFRHVQGVPVVAVAPPVEAPAAAGVPLPVDLPPGFLFLFMFDYMSTTRRKNPVALIEAFKRAFAPGEGPQLLIKTLNAPLRPMSEEELLWATHGRPDIHIVDRSLTPAEKDALIAGCDCYVSLHRSEGFGLTMAEAMAIGKPVIATGYSGNVDFMDESNSFLVDYELTTVGPDCDIYPADGTWAEPSIAHAAALLRRVYDDPEKAAQIGMRAREDIARKLSPEATGDKMRRRLQELESGVSTESAPGERLKRNRPHA